MLEEKLKHLEFIQNTISRLAQNSFTYKGWAVTILAGGVAISKELPGYILILAVVPSLLAFWALDSFYLSQERQYRKLYDDVISHQSVVPSFSMKAERLKFSLWLSALFSKPLMALYLPMIMLTLLVGCIKWCGLWQ
jgi:hypothetical protein